MVAQEDLLHALQAGLDGGELLHQIDAVGVVIHHAPHTIEVASRDLEPQRRLLLVLRFHRSALLGPYSRGVCPVPLYHPRWGGVNKGRPYSAGRRACAVILLYWLGRVAREALAGTCTGRGDCGFCRPCAGT